MTRVAGFLKAAYNFFAGDPIILTGVIAAFVLAAILEHVLGASYRQTVTGIVFVGLIVASITLALRRELGDRPKHS